MQNVSIHGFGPGKVVYIISGSCVPHRFLKVGSTEQISWLEGRVFETNCSWIFVLAVEV